MKTFKDTAGREWAVSVTVATCMRVKSACGFELGGVFSEGMSGLKSLSEPVTLATVLYAVLQPQVEKLQLTVEQFAEGLAGDALWDAFRALRAELVDFFQHPEGRKALREMMDANDRLASLASREAVAEIAEAEAEALRAIGEAKKAKAKGSPPPPSGGPSGTAPASSGSTPGAGG